MRLHKEQVRWNKNETQASSQMEGLPGTFRQAGIFGIASAISLILGRLDHEKWPYQSTVHGK